MQSLLSEANYGSNPCCNGEPFDKGLTMKLVQASVQAVERRSS